MLARYPMGEDDIKRILCGFLQESAPTFSVVAPLYGLRQITVARIILVLPCTLHLHLPIQ